MTELDMIKAFADLEGIEVEGLLRDADVFAYVIKDINIGSASYNPITNLSLTFKAMVKYKVDVIGSEGLVEIDGEHVTFYQKDSLLPKAIIECILKSKGLYK